MIQAGELKETFNTVVDEYDRWRPTYVDELYQQIFAARPMDETCRALEVGIGTGQATLPVLKTGCEVVAVELGEQMAAYSRKKFAAWPKFRVVNLPFEQFEAEEQSFDLIFSATAFHWVDEKMGYEKAYRLLKKGGVFARFANHPNADKGRPQLHDAIQPLYAKYRPGERSRSSREEYGMQQAQAVAQIAEKYGFVDISTHLYRRTRDFTARQYTGLLGTYSDNLAMEEGVRRRFFAEIEQAIDSLGGIITLYDTIDLELARKP